MHMPVATVIPCIVDGTNKGLNGTRLTVMGLELPNKVPLEVCALVRQEPIQQHLAAGVSTCNKAGVC